MTALVYGLVKSSIFFLMAMGFSLVYGVTRVANFAHGALYVVGGFVTWGFLNWLGLPWWAAVILSLLVLMLIGVALYRFCLIRVRGMEISEIILSFAVALLILEGLRLKIGAFKGLLGAKYWLPVIIDGSVNVLGVPIDFQRLFCIAGALLMLMAVYLITRYTKVGLSLAAVANDERAALMLGVDSDRAATVSLALGSALVGLASILILPLGMIYAETGYEVLCYAIAVCIIGGLGSWIGTVIASVLLGFGTAVSTAILGPMYESVVLFGSIILVLVIRPSGLFGKQKELEERV
jgi:branched-chain amino acid transport system permease protein